MDKPSVERDERHDHLAKLEQDHPHACLDGYVYLGYTVEGEDGEETERIERLPCRRCAEEERV